MCPQIKSSNALNTSNLRRNNISNENYDTLFQSDTCHDYDEEEAAMEKAEDDLRSMIYRLMKWLRAENVPSEKIIDCLMFITSEESSKD